ncbi:MAG: HAD family hydrolase [Ruminococcus sp.]|nr:HAD family hydrolase [Ruminococcus sp.]
MNAVIFDLDGTLWDSSNEVVIAWNEVLSRATDGKLQIDKEFMQSIMGKNMEEIKNSIFADYPIENINKIFDDCLANEQIYLHKNGAKIYPQLEETLSKLAEKYELSIVSNCQCGYIEAFLEYYNNIEKFFSDRECFGNTLKEKDENIKSVIMRNNYKKAFYVGDTLGDYNSAVKAGAVFIHADYGFGEVPQAKYRISALSELPDLLEEINENSD